MQCGNEFIPFWLLNYVNTEDYGEGFYKQGDSQYDASYSNLRDCFWDSKKGKVVVGILKDVYPEKYDFNVDEVILREVSHSSYTLDKIVEIVFEEFDTNVIKVKKMDVCEKKYFTEEELINMKTDDMYEMRMWKPFYKLESGLLIKWNHKIKKFVK